MNQRDRWVLTLSFYGLAPFLSWMALSSLYKMVVEHQFINYMELFITSILFLIIGLLFCDPFRIIRK
jgi:drug/metabolite transporter (DMT)-like permease